MVKRTMRTLERKGTGLREEEVLGRDGMGAAGGGGDGEVIQSRSRAVSEGVLSWERRQQDLITLFNEFRPPRTKQDIEG